MANQMVITVGIKLHPGPQGRLFRLQACLLQAQLLTSATASECETYVTPRDTHKVLVLLVRQLNILNGVTTEHPTRRL